MADIQTLKKLLAEEYGITTARELDEAMKKIGGLNIGVFALMWWPMAFTSMTGTHGRNSGISSRKTAGWMLNESGKPVR